MKKIFLALLIGLFLNACASIPEKINMVEDPGSPAKVALLRERVDTFWMAFVNTDYETAYAIYDPFFTMNTNKHLFMGKLGTIKYKSFNIKDIKVDGNVAHVTVDIIYFVPKAKFKRQEFTYPETKAQFVEIWLYIYDNWYKEYRSQVDSSSGVADY